MEAFCAHLALLRCEKKAGGRADDLKAPRKKNSEIEMQVQNKDPQKTKVSGRSSKRT